MNLQALRDISWSQMYSFQETKRKSNQLYDCNQLMYHMMQ